MQYSRKSGAPVKISHSQQRKLRLIAYSKRGRFHPSLKMLSRVCIRRLSHRLKNKLGKLRQTRKSIKVTKIRNHAKLKRKFKLTS